MAENKSNRIISMLHHKCPNCHIGDMYVNKSIFPLNKLMTMHERCSHCGQKYELETGFWFGTGYISYGISVGLIITIALLFTIFHGFSWQDNSIFIFLGIIGAVLVLLQPWIMRLSRSIYIYLFVGYGKGTPLSNKKNESNQ